MNAARFDELVGRYSRLRIAVVGDFCLDRYLEIDPARAETSLETGLPVYNVSRVRPEPGGAGTIVNNLSALGVGTIPVIGLCGDDGEGFELRRALAARPGVVIDDLLTSPRVHTFTYCKPLVLSAGQPPRELNRLDTKNWAPTPVELQALLAERLAALAPTLDALIVLEQVERAETGVVTSRLLDAVASVQQSRPELVVLADSRRGLAHFPPVGFKMNRAELSRLAGAADSLGAVRRAAGELARRNGQPVFVTLAEEGMVAAMPGGAIEHVPALPPRGPIDIVGAGDCVTANLAAALAAGAAPSEAIHLASAAASVVIHILGATGAASPDELRRWAIC